MFTVIWALNNTNVRIVIVTLAIFQIVQNTFDNVRPVMFNHLVRKTRMCHNTSATFVINVSRVKWEWSNISLNVHKSLKCNVDYKKASKKWMMKKIKMTWMQASSMRKLKRKKMELRKYVKRLRKLRINHNQKEM